VSFNSNQLRQVEIMDEEVSQREREIKQISKSIRELADIFKDMAMLVVEQGTMLDRIDFNIEQTKTHTDKAVEELVDAKKYQAQYRNKLCMLLLCVGILVMIVVVIIRINV